LTNACHSGPAWPHAAGLAIVRDLAELYRGSLELTRSTPGGVAPPKGYPPLPEAWFEHAAINLQLRLMPVAGLTFLPWVWIRGEPPPNQGYPPFGSDPLSSRSTAATWRSLGHELPDRVLALGVVLDARRRKRLRSSRRTAASSRTPHFQGL
jgi:hypothetical protein